jgi:8-oxo-dGTP pyrophosphatase MutT (NUDIX family)
LWPADFSCPPTRLHPIHSTRADALISNFVLAGCGEDHLGFCANSAFGYKLARSMPLSSKSCSSHRDPCKIELVRIQHLELAFAPRAWPFAETRRDEIARHFAQVKQAKPAVWNGRILLLHDHLIEGDVFRGAYFETDYASFVAWKDWGYPDTAVRHCFSLGALRGCDGGFLLGVMNSHTLNAGKIYFPTGVPDPTDIIGGIVDLAASIQREMAEETGLHGNAYEAEEGWYSVLTRPHIAHFKILHAPDTAAALRVRIRGHLARETQPELADVRIVRSATDLDPMMPITVRTFLTYIWRQASECEP